MSIKKYISVGLLVLFVFIACKNGNEEIVPTGDPLIHYVRVTPPESSDSLLVSAFQGGLIAIIGENLAHANEVWFNDLQADLNPVYITNEAILVNVPTEVPKEVSNQLRLYFSNGDSLFHNFEVEISKPEINAMKSEYVFAGEVATIYGSFFYEPLTVTFCRRCGRNRFCPQKMKMELSSMLLCRKEQKKGRLLLALILDRKNQTSGLEMTEILSSAVIHLRVGGMQTMLSSRIPLLRETHPLLMVIISELPKFYWCLGMD